MTNGRVRRMLRRFRAGWCSRCSRDGEALRANSIVGPFPGWPAGGWGVRAGVAAMPGVRPGAGPTVQCGCVRRRSPRRQTGAGFRHERCWPAEVCLSVARWLEFGEPRPGETARELEVPPFDVVRTGTAVGHEGADVRERREESPVLGGERVLAAAACAVQPPDFAIGMLRRQGLKHGENWRGSDPDADQEHGRMRAVEYEGATRRCDVELVADRQPGVQIAAGDAVVLPLTVIR